MNLVLEVVSKRQSSSALSFSLLITMVIDSRNRESCSCAVLNDKERVMKTTHQLSRLSFLLISLLPFQLGLALPPGAE